MGEEGWFHDSFNLLCVFFLLLKVVLPMLCSYMSHWWEHGPESNPHKADSCCTSVTSEHMNTLLGNILKIIYNNLGIDEGAWMKRLAGKHNDTVWHSCVYYTSQLHFISKCINEFLYKAALDSFTFNVNPLLSGLAWLYDHFTHMCTCLHMHMLEGMLMIIYWSKSTSISSKSKL